MKIELEQGFISALKESDLKLNLYLESTDDKFYYIWDKERQILSLSILKCTEGAKDITIYYEKKYLGQNTNQKTIAIKLTENNDNLNKFVEIDLSNLGVESDIESSLPEELSLAEEYNLDIGSNLFSVSNNDTSNLITKRSFTKFRNLVKTVNTDSDFDYGKTILNTNGETVYRKFKYRRYKKDSFLPKIIGASSTTTENDLDCYIVGNLHRTLRLSGKIEYTDIIVENNKILEEINGYQDINEIPSLKIEKKYSSEKNIWRDNVVVDKNYNIIIPENKDLETRKEVLIISVSFVDYDNTIINLSKELKIIQTENSDELKPWKIEYNLDSVKLEYENLEDKVIPVLIFQEPFLDLTNSNPGTDLKTTINLACHPDFLNEIKNNKVKITYEYLSEDYSCDKSAKDVFTEFFNIEDNGIFTDSDGIQKVKLDITAKSLIKRNISLVDNLWYPYLNQKPLIIKTIISIDLNNYLGINQFNSEFIFIRQPENIHKYGSISNSDSEIIIDDYNFDLGIGKFKINFDVSSDNLEKNENGEINYINYCGWVLDKINPISIINENKLNTRKNNGTFITISDNNIYSIEELNFDYLDYSKYLYSLEDKSSINNNIGYITFYGLSSYYFKNPGDKNFSNIYSRLIENKELSSWKKTVFMTHKEVKIVLNPNTKCYSKKGNTDELFVSSNYNEELNTELSKVSDWIEIGFCEVNPIYITSISPYLEIIDLNNYNKVDIHKYYSGNSKFKIFKKILETSIDNNSSIDFRVGSSNFSIKIKNNSDLSVGEYKHIPSKNFFKVIGESEEGLSKYCVIGNGSIKIEGSGDILFRKKEDIGLEFSLGSHITDEENNVYLNIEYDEEFNYKNHSLDLEKIGVLGTYIGKYPIKYDSKYIADLITEKQNYDLGSIDFIDVEIDKLIYPKFFDKLGNEFTSLELLNFKCPTSYRERFGEDTVFFPILSNYPLSTSEIDLEDGYKWKESKDSFLLSSNSGVNIDYKPSEEFKDFKDNYVGETTTTKENYHTESNYDRHILNYFKLTSKEKISSIKIESNVCSSNIFKDYYVEDMYNNPVKEIIPPAIANIELKQLNEVTNPNHNELNEYIVFDNKQYIVGTSVTLDTIYGVDKNNLELDYNKWFQSSLDSVNFGTIDTVIMRDGDSKKVIGFDDNNTMISNFKNSNYYYYDLENITLENSTKDCGPLFGITKTPIKLSLSNLIYDNKKNIYNLIKDNDVWVSLTDFIDIKLREFGKYLNTTTYEINFNFRNYFYIDEKENSYQYNKKIIIPWKGIDYAVLRSINDDSDIELISPKEDLVEINLGTVSWDITNESLKLFPIFLDENGGDLANIYNKDHNYYIKLSRNIKDYYNKFSPIVSDSGYAIVTNNLSEHSKVEERELLLKDIFYNISFNFSQNLEKDSRELVFDIPLDNNKRLSVKFQQESIKQGEDIVTIEHTIDDEECILLHSSGYCINDIDNVGILTISSKTTSIYDYSRNCIYLYDWEGNEIVNNALISKPKEDDDIYIITVHANFPTRYIKPDAENLKAYIGDIHIKNDLGVVLKKVNCYQGYTYAKLFDNIGNEYLVEKTNLEYIGKVGTRDNPIIYSFDSEFPSYNVCFYQRELDLILDVNNNNKFVNELSKNEVIMTTSERVSTNANYSSITLNNLGWILTGNSKYLIKSDYNTDIIYNNSGKFYPILVHEFKYDYKTNYEITSNDLINIKVGLCLSNHKLTSSKDISNNSIQGSDLINNSPIIYDFWIKLNNSFN